LLLVVDSVHSWTEAAPTDVDEYTALNDGLAALRRIARNLQCPVLAIAERRGWIERVHWGMEVNTASISGFLRFWLLARLRAWRPRSYRYQEEQRAIEEAVRAFGPRGVVGYHRLRTRRAGARRYVDLHVQFRAGTTLEDAHAIAHELQDAIRGRVRGADVLIHLEPERNVRPGTEI